MQYVADTWDVDFGRTYEILSLKHDGWQWKLRVKEIPKSDKPSIFDPGPILAPANLFIPVDRGLRKEYINDLVNRDE